MPAGALCPPRGLLQGSPSLPCRLAPDCRHKCHPASSPGIHSGSARVPSFRIRLFSSTATVSAARQEFFRSCHAGRNKSPQSRRSSFPRAHRQILKWCTVPAASPTSSEHQRRASSPCTPRTPPPASAPSPSAAAAAGSSPPARGASRIRASSMSAARNPPPFPARRAVHPPCRSRAGGSTRPAPGLSTPETWRKPPAPAFRGRSARRRTPSGRFSAQSR
ncbi:unknown [Faecalibacterium sp. CAG:74]|nr:unknown [Faecalibacterium sp. CAG:74]